MIVCSTNLILMTLYSMKQHLNACEFNATGSVLSPPPPLLNNHKNIGFLCNTAPDLLKLTKLPSQQSMLGHHLPANSMAFRSRANDGPFIAVF